MDYEQGNVIERVVWYQTDLITRCRETANRSRQLRDVAIQLRADRPGRSVAESR